jgi:hypothetical protein
MDQRLLASTKIHIYAGQQQIVDGGFADHQSVYHASWAM